MFLLDLAVEEPGVIIPERELRQIVIDAEMHEKLFYELLRVVMKAYGSASTKNNITDIRQAISAIEQWISLHYIDIRKTIPDDVKHLYLKEIAFRVHER